MLFFYQTFSLNSNKYSVNRHSTYENASFFHTITTGHYWRNSYIKELQLMTKGDNNDFCIQIWQAEKEEDEYELLEILTEKIKDTKLIYSYNSISFHLPYLKNKYKAYGLEYPFTDIEHVDLLQRCKPIGKALNLSLKLSDLRLYFKEKDEEPEIKIIFDTLYLLQYEEFFKGAFTIESVTHAPDALYAALSTPLMNLLPLHLNHPAFYLILENDSVKVQLRLFDGRLRVYYPNYQDYYYLPDEDMIIHKSMASGISKDKKEKATYETCYHYAQLPDKISCEYIRKYLLMLFKHLYIRN